MKTIWKAVLAVIIMIVIAMIINTVIAQFTMSYYTDPAYFGVWSKVMMPAEGPPPASFFWYSALFQLITAIFFVLIYYLLGSAVPGRKANQGLMYGLFVFLVGALPGMLSLILLINLPIGIVLWWMLSGLIVSLLAGLFTALLVNPKHELKIIKKTEVEIK